MPYSFSLGLQRPQIRRAGAGRPPGALAIHPDQQQEVQAVVAVFDQPDIGFAALHVGECIGNVGCGLERGFLDQFLVAAIGDAKRYAYPQYPFAQRPVRQSRRDELRVRHDDVDVVVGIDERAAHVDRLDGPCEAGIELDVVTHPQRVFEQDNEAGNKIIDDRLQPEADADTEGAGDQRQVAEVQSDRGQRDDEPKNDDCVVAEPTHRVQRRLRTARFRLPQLAGSRDGYRGTVGTPRSG